MPPRALVFGSGSIGGVYAWVLSRAVGESNIYTVCRSNYAAASKHGFTINSMLFGNNLNVRPVVVRTVEEAVEHAQGEPFDYVVVTAKAIPSTPSIPDHIRPAVGPNTAIVLIQNGIGIEGIYQKAFPDNPLISGVVYLPATQTSPGVIAHREVENLHLGTFPATAPASHKAAVEAFAALLRAGGATAIVQADVQNERWTKLLVNASWNPICALSRSRDAQLLHSSDHGREVVRAVMLEVSAIARAAGYEGVSAERVDYQLGRAWARELPGVEPSMLADALGGRRLEVDAIVGNALTIAEEKGVQTPLLRMLYALIKALDERIQDG